MEVLSIVKFSSSYISFFISKLHEFLLSLKHHKYIQKGIKRSVAYENLKKKLNIIASYFMFCFLWDFFLSGADILKQYIYNMFKFYTSFTIYYQLTEFVNKTELAVLYKNANGTQSNWAAEKLKIKYRTNCPAA